MRRRRFLATLAAGMLSGAAGLWANGRPPTYRVRKGDTLSKIARLHGISVRDLKRENGLKDDLIRIGQVLKLPAKLETSYARVRNATESLAVPMLSWSLIVGHHSGIRNGNAAAYHRGHLRRGMSNGLAYHFVIGNGIDSGDGEIEIGSRWTKQLPGGHVRSSAVNGKGIGICCVGDFETGKPTPRQLESFLWLCGYLQETVGSRRLAFAVHKEIDPGHTVCPGRNFPTKSLRNRFEKL